MIRIVTVILFYLTAIMQAILLVPINPYFIISAIAFGMAGTLTLYSIMETGKT